MDQSINQQTKQQARQKRTRKKLAQVSSRPRLHVFRSIKHTYAQVIDDQKHQTIASASDHEEAASLGTKTERAMKVGELVAMRALEKKVKQVKFDRGSYRYHGRVKAIAEAARKVGLEF